MTGFLKMLFVELYSCLPWITPLFTRYRDELWASSCKRPALRGASRLCVLKPCLAVIGLILSLSTTSEFLVSVDFFSWNYFLFIRKISRLNCFIEFFCMDCTDKVSLAPAEKRRPVAFRAGSSSWWLAIEEG